MVKYAIDLHLGDRLIPDVDSGRVVIVDYLEEQDDGIYVEGYFEDDGEEYLDLLESDEELQVTKE